VKQNFSIFSAYYGLLVFDHCVVILGNIEPSIQKLIFIHVVLMSTAGTGPLSYLDECRFEFYVLLPFITRTHI